MKSIVLILAVSVLASGCAQNVVCPTVAPEPSPQAEPISSGVRPKADDIIEFKADPIPVRTHFKDFKVERKELEDILRAWYQVSQEHWLHGYSHVALEDRTGTIKLKEGTGISWMVRPGGLAELIFQDGTVLYLARELTPWEKDTELTVELDGCVAPDKRELQLVCSMTRTEFAVEEKLPPPKVTIRNNTNADVDIIGPTITVIVCTLVQPDKTIVPMCIAMPTGRDPRQMPPRKLKARTAIELTAAGIWYYEETSGFEPYVFQKEGAYEFKCKYEELNSNTITITVRKNAEPAARKAEHLKKF